MGIVKGVGLNEARTTDDLKNTALKAEIDRNLTLGRDLGLTGTPSYVVGDAILSGAVGFDRLKQAVAAARAAKAG
jgi:protein-disulfide isomerase